MPRQKKASKHAQDSVVSRGTITSWGEAKKARTNNQGEQCSGREGQLASWI